MIKEQLRSQYCSWLTGCIIDQMSMVMTNDSGKLAETAFQVLPDSTFELIWNFVDDDSPADEQKAMLLDALVNYVAGRVRRELTGESYTMGLSNLLGLLTCESLRRKGLLEYSWPHDIFADCQNDNGFSRLTTQGMKYAVASLETSVTVN
jgi:hypothetical protein